MEPTSIKNIDAAFCKRLSIFFADIDDTITTHGKLPATTFDAMWELKENGIKFVPVTGRPAGWCDMIARMWPVAGVVGENGAFYYSYDEVNRKFIRRYVDSDEKRAESRKRLQHLRQRVLKEVPGCGIASDQEFRTADLAIDFCEDVKRLPQDQIDRICKIAAEEGTTAKVSSIHVNCWYGDYDKVSCFNTFINDFTGKTLEDLQEEIIFAGDSPNDEPMFKALHHSIAVANIKNFLDKITYKPRYITQKESGEGFYEAVQLILKKRNS